MQIEEASILVQEAIKILTLKESSEADSYWLAYRSISQELY